MSIETLLEEIKPVPIKNHEFENQQENKNNSKLLAYHKNFDLCQRCKKIPIEDFSRQKPHYRYRFKTKKLWSL